MLSRRKFLQANVAGLAVSSAGASASAASLPTANQATIEAPNGETDYWNDWPAYLTAHVNKARARRLSDLRSIASAAGVQKRIEQIRSTVWRLLGGEFEKTPLQPRTVGVIDRGGYRLEKVVFESQPAVFVTAHLYVPQQREPPFPGIIVPLGHPDNGKLWKVYQYLNQTLARKGYMVLTYDPFGQGERWQFLGSTPGPLRYPGPSGEHWLAGRPLLLLGSGFAQYRTWDGIRALDYLLSRPEVDPERIGCTGQSGGGTMTMYLAGLEPRIKAAVVVDGNSENLAGPSYAPPGAVADSEQNIPASLPEGIDRGDLLLAFAPKPLLICYTPADAGTTYAPSFTQGNQEVYAELQAAYRLMGAAEKVSLYTKALPHDYDFFSRRAACEWFNRWLGQEDWGSDEAGFDESAPDALNCTATGQVLTSLGGRSIVQLNTDRLRALAPVNPLGSTPGEAQAFRERARRTLKELLALPTERTVLDSRIYSSSTRKDVIIEEFVIHSEPYIRVPGWFLKPAHGGEPFPAILYVSEGDRNQVLDERSEVAALVGKGFALCAVDLRNLGDCIPRYPAAGPHFYGPQNLQEFYPWTCFCLGKPLLGQRVWDYLRTLDYLQSRPDVDRSRIHGLGQGGAALAVLLSSVIDDRVHSVLLDSPIATYRSIVESPVNYLHVSWYLYGVLKHFDLPDLAGCLAPRRCWLLNSTDARGEPLPESQLASLYEHALGIFRQSGASEGLQFKVCPEREKAKTVESWLQS